MTEIRPRIVGTETEWAISEKLVGDTGFKQLEPATEITQYLHPGIKVHSTYTSNGGRYYTDVGHVEYATPEDSSIESLVVSELAGEKIVADSLRRIFSQRDKSQEIRLNKRVVDNHSTTWGYHVNLQANREAIPEMNDKYLHLLGLHLATSLPLIGSGALVRGWKENDEPTIFYGFGQKLNGITSDFQLGTTNGTKGIINTRDESHANSNKYMRVHLTNMDPHVSPWATILAVGSCSLILRAIEQGKGGDLRLDQTQEEEPLLALARRNNRDLTMKNVIASVGGMAMRQFDIQSRILEVVRSTDHTDEEAAIIEEWQRAVDDIETDPYLLTDRSDSIARLDLIQKHAAKHGVENDIFTSPAAIQIDLMYDRMFVIKRQNDNGAGESTPPTLPDKLRASRFARSMPDRSDIEGRMFTPPATTRALERGRMIGNGRVGKVAIRAIDWKQCTDKNLNKFVMDDPYETGEWPLVRQGRPGIVNVNDF